MAQLVYEVRVPLAGQPDGYLTVARCLTPETVGDVVRALVANSEPPLAGPSVRVQVTICKVGE